MKTASRKLFVRLFLCCAAATLSSCGGGGGGGSGAGAPPPPPPAGTLSLSTSSISFKAAAPYAKAPFTQTITGTVTNLTASGTLYITVAVNNPNSLFTVTNVTITGNSGQLNVIPATPSSLGVGSFHGTLTVSACLNDPTCQTGQLAGSPQTIPVDYDVPSGVDGDTVTPHVVPANTAGTVILRGAGFTGATGVSFGSVSATSVTVVSDSEIHASYPALPAGTYSVAIDSGAISYTASLVAFSPPAFTQTVLPVGNLTTFSTNLEYDAQRTAVFALLPPQTGPTNILMRYAFDGGAWSATQTSLTDVQEIKLSPDGTHLLVLVQGGEQSSMEELDPVTMAETNVTTLPTRDTCSFSFANDGNAIVGLGPPPDIMFGTFSRVLTPMSAALGGCPAAASGNGAIVALGGANYVASSEVVVQPGPIGGSADLAGDEFLSGDEVMNQSGQILGYLSTVFSVINPAGTRAYGYTQDPVSCAPTLTTFDLTATPSGSPKPQFPVLGTPIAVPSSCENSSSGYDLIITPDGSTVFISRPDGVVVQPVP